MFTDAAPPTNSVSPRIHSYW